jgi:photosystem II stability/assembly factor-like uncharacterized protein
LIRVKINTGKPVPLRNILLLTVYLASWRVILPAAISSASPWAPVGPYGGDVRAIAVDPISPSTIYAALGGLGVYRTRDGTNWQFVRDALSAASITDVTSLGVSLKSELFAGTTQGLFRSADGGASWTSAGFGLEPIGTLVLSRGQPERIYVSSGYPSHLSWSSDSGATWTDAQVGGVTALAVGRGYPETVYATSWQTVCAGPCLPGLVFKTSDGGRTWNLEDLTDVKALLVDPKNPGIVYAGPRPGGGVFKSIDGGLRWTAAGPDSLPFAVSTLAADSNSVLYVGTTEGGVFESFDGGQNWTGISAGLADLRIRTLVVADSPRGPTLYAGTIGSGIFRLAGLTTVSRPGNPSRVVQPRR